MMLLDWIQRLADSAGLAGDPGQARLPSRGQFLRMLRRERARADRAGSQFSLLALESGGPACGGRSGDGRATLYHLLRLLRRRLRVTDDVGWLDRRRLGVILPDTPAWGAWALVDDLCLAFPTDVPLFHSTVYVYPDEQSEAGAAGDESAAEPVPARRPESAATPAQPVEPLLVRRLPAWKRGLDVAGAIGGLLVLAPVLLLAAAAVKLSSRGPVLFVQWRRGLGGRPFRLYKFRTMVADAEDRKADVLGLNERDGPVFKTENDPRVTGLGHWLRKTSLDELPQLWNVLRGDMSLVGPRPLPVAEADACRGWHGHRADVTPGITCIWQTRGRGEVPFVEWMRMDARYVRSRSLIRDLLLLVKTVPAVLLRRNQ